MKYDFAEAVHVQSYDLDGVVHTFSGGPGVVDLSEAEIELLSRLAPGCATLYVAPPAPPAPAPAPAPAAPSEV